MESIYVDDMATYVFQKYNNATGFHILLRYQEYLKENKLSQAAMSFMAPSSNIFLIKMTKGDLDLNFYVLDDLDTLIILTKDSKIIMQEKATSTNYEIAFYKLHFTEFTIYAKA